MCNKDTLQIVLSVISQKARETFGDALESIILFSSYARGDYDGESDIDIIILVDMSDEKLATYRRAVSTFSTDLDLQYDIFTSIKLKDLSAFEARKDALPFYRKILEEGIQVNA